MARILIVGCGCRGTELAGVLIAAGYVVRGTTRRADRLDEIAATGAEAFVADPDRLSTLLPAIEGVAVMVWLMGTASGDPEAVAALHGPRLESMLETLVDTHVRGVVYEAVGTVQRALLDEGASAVGSARERFHMPAEVVEADLADPSAWLEAMKVAVNRVLSS